MAPVSIVVVSPHLDDAVLSVGEWIASREGLVTIVSVFAGEPPDDDASAVVRARRREDIAACGALGASWRHLPFLDHCFGVQANSDQIARALNLYLQSATEVLWPLGIHHPDHRQTSDIARLAIHNHRSDIGFYEELPYRVLFPVDTAEQIEKLRVGRQIRVEQCGGKLAEKHAAVGCYETQVGEDIERCAFAPERIWWVQK